MRRRHALVVGLAGLTAACARTSSAPATPAPPTPQPAQTPAPQPAAVATPLATIAPTPQPTPSTVPTATPVPEIGLDVHLWNGEAELQIDGRTIEPGHLSVPRGTHQLAALVDGEVAALADVPPDGGTIDLVVPPPHASLAIMIENQADARPQSGLSGADVVYEALAEGGITRFIAVYLSGDAPLVGPVRSLRHYFAFMAADYGADVVHIGASPEGFTWRDAMNMGYLDESAGDPGVWRVRTRVPPHNAYTDTAADRGFLQQMGRQQNRRWGPLLFDAQAPSGAEAAEQIALGFLPWPYRVGYTWAAGQGRYLRTMEGIAHVDAATGERIAPATVVVQFADVEAIPNDPKLRLDVNLVGGSGDLVVFSNGSRREGTWSKSAPRSTSRWLDANGKPLVIPPGPVWVEVVPLDSPLTSS
jgi:hypothetical protein